MSLKQIVNIQICLSRHTSAQKFVISDSLDNNFQYWDAMTGIKYHGQQAFEAEFRTSSKQGGRTIVACKNV